MKAVVENLEGLEDVSPILALVVQALVNHVHDIVEIVRAAASLNQSGPHVAEGLKEDHTC